MLTQRQLDSSFPQPLSWILGVWYILTDKSPVPEITQDGDTVKN